ncbi:MULTISPECIES: AAA family ATPase [unclassified Sphingomonas]|uniref:AAA family ATPase n=1 Tax=unclassified Sphingomonas TaxID=196159 RepID=UPI000FED902E|nr:MULTISPECIES: AAA family ATPase [unclassified Sphingomonas]RKE45883.1 ATPase family protein associated with various cellular activities (AAA) [Sphingomonas sp. PP-CC-1A-547]TCM06831.1 ATPase family protein associated with various cellular activities (AAA) [Sphingomonas sp. PP-CC-3G-468]
MVVDGKPHVRPCVSIPTYGNEANKCIASIGDVYSPLTTPLPLAGAPMLARTRGNESHIAATLRAEAPWMDAVIGRLADQATLQLRAGLPWLSFRPLLLVGPAGAGKTHLARRIGELSGCSSAILSLAGASSNAELAGSPRGFRHPQPNFAAMAMLRTGIANPVIVVDEVEKAASGDLGDPVATLLGLLDRSTSSRYFDGCLAAEIDLSHVNWILTANRIDRLPEALLSRVEVVEVLGPGPAHAEMIVASLWRDIARDFGLPPSALPRVEAAAQTALLRLFRNTRSLRRLRRAIETLVAVSGRHVPRTLN